MCNSCQQFEETIAITNVDELEKAHNHIYFRGVKPEVLRILDGSLQFDNEGMDCVLRCNRCGQQFELRTGKSGGVFGAVNPPAA